MAVVRGRLWRQRPAVRRCWRCCGGAGEGGGGSEFLFQAFCADAKNASEGGDGRDSDIKDGEEELV
jgi:hypothetical protein